MSSFKKKLGYIKYYFSVFITFVKNISFKRFLLKLKYGKRLKIKHSDKLYKGADIIIQKNSSVKMGKCVRIKNNALISSVGGGTLSIGNDTFINRNCNIVARKEIVIGDKVMIGPNVCIFDHDHKYNSETIFNNDFLTDKIVIEDGCWICSGAIILKGTHVGKCSIIGAGTVVKGDVPPHSIVTTKREQVLKPIERSE